ncbi:MAG: tRNA (adenosine(37)-N6)-threonylcarbamoyltransferase complex dimerization subunit type 1 TsaB [Zwartia sp.]
MTYILALETSTTTCSVALLTAQGASVTVVQRQLEGTAGHAANLLPMVSALLAECGVERGSLSAVAFGQGPGAFTGIRVACGVAQGMGLALQIPLVPIGALPAVAVQAAQRLPQYLILAALDARMDEAYFAAYLDDVVHGLVVLQPPVLLPAAQLSAFIAQRLPLWRSRSPDALGVCYAGEGWGLTGAVASLPFECHPDDLQARPNAQAVATLALRAWHSGQTVSPEHAAPLYLRDRVAFTVAERALGEGGNPRARAPGQAALVPMTATDLPEALEIERAVQSFPWTLKNFEDALEEGYEAWFLRQEGELLGFCIAMQAPDVAHILVIAVAPDHQRQGHAQQLLAQITRSAQAQSAEGLLLEVRPSNDAALAFYAREGFTQIGVRRDYYPAGRGAREDAYVLKKTFDQS